MNGGRVVPGSAVTLHFSMSLSDGTEAVSTFGEDPMSLVMGDGTLTDGMELALYGLTPGEDQTLTLTPEQAFGHREEEKVHRIPREQISPGMEMEPGLIIDFESATGEEITGTVLELDDQMVTLDFNHPLAGHAVVFRVKIIETSDPPEPRGE